ncbi:hypothetical protein L7F22_043034 [Adiantum nelumboides]|nr:hypothetical protein [Adiantum nelumboides]MCO5589069.1 hypothetical protein [Adiantum nelumboides]
MCTNPTRYDESFSFVGMSKGEGLVPVSGSSYYLVSLSSMLATYQLVYNSSAEARSSMAEGKVFTAVLNVATSRSLAWVEVDGEYVLIESDSKAVAF